MKRILVAIAVGALSSLAVLATPNGQCSGPNATIPGGVVTGELDIYGSGSSGADFNNVLVQNGTILPQDTTGTCVVNGATFSNFQVVTNTITGPQPTGFNLALAVIGGTVAQFTYSLTGPDTLNDLELFYQIGGGGALGSGVTTMSLNGESSSTVTENICGNAGFTFNPSNPQTGCGSTAPLAQLTSTSLNEIAGPVTFGSVVTDFVNKDIQGGSEIQQDPGSAVPEPMTLSLMGLGLLGVGLLGRRARR